MRSKKLISAAAAFSMVVSSFAGIAAANAEDTETVYNFSSLTESSYSKAGASVFDGALTLSGTESIKPTSVNTAITTPLGNVENVTSALITKQLAVKLHLDAGETVVEYYCGSDSGASSGKAIDVVVKDAAGNVVASEANAENSGVKPYVISYTAAEDGDYTIVDSGSSTNRTIVYAVATTTGTYTPPAADATAVPATQAPNTTLAPDATQVPTTVPKVTADPTGVADITITNSAGWLETAYVTWTNPTPVDYYNVYVKPVGGTYTKIDDELIRYYGSYYRADALGLKAGSYQMKVEPVIGGAAQEAEETGVLEVKPQVREGFAFDPASPNYNADGVGGYKNDGTVKDDAKIVYITDANKDTVQFDVITNASKGTVTSCTGLGEILAAREKNGAETTPLIIRMIGQVESPAGKNSSGYMQIKATSNITFEGVGDDATTYHWSFLLRDTNNVEVRNLAVMEFYDDGISLDTDNFNDWIHNCDIFYGQNRGGDQVKGDGSLDVKTGSDYCTFSYNHFWDSGKSSLCGMTADSYKGYHMTYHHNWFDHSDSRHPRVRGDQVHVYNNFYDGNSKYGIGSCTGSSIYVEKNVFRNCLHPVLISRQGTDALGDGTFSGEDGGVIKMYDNAVYGGISIIYASETNTNDFDAYLAKTRYEQVPSEYCAKQGGGTYSNFDTAADMYEYTPTDTADVVDNVQTYAGRIEGGDFTHEFDDAVDDALYTRDSVLGDALQTYTTSLVTEYATGDTYPGTGGEMPTSRPTAEPFDPDAQPTAKPSDSGSTGGETSETTVIWRASDTGADVTAGTVLKDDWLTLAGAELEYASTTKTIGGVALTGKMAGLTANSKPSLENPEAGAALKFTPSSDGTIKVYFKLNAGKTFYITDASETVIASHENTTSSSEYTTLSADVTAGTIYYAFGDGTNAEFWAAEYTSTGGYSDDAEEATEQPTAQPTATATPVVTAQPTAAPTATATPVVTAQPTAAPTATATPVVTAQPTAAPTATAIPDVTAQPTAAPTAAATPVVTEKPTATPDATIAPTDAAETTAPEITEKPTAVPCAPLTPLSVKALPKNIIVRFDAGYTPPAEGEEKGTGTIYTEPAVFGDYVAVYAGTHEDTLRNIDIDASNKSIGDNKYATRIKLGGTAVFDANDAPALRTISVIPSEAGTLRIDFAHASSSGDDRILAAYQNGEIIGEKAISANSVSMLYVTAAADEPVYIYSKDSGINIYGIELIDIPVETETPTVNPVKALPVDTRVVFDAGVTEDEAGTKTGTSFTEKTLFGDYVIAYADTAIDASNKTINDTKYASRIKLGGKTALAGAEPTARAVSVIPAEAGTLRIDFAHASNSGDDRTLKAYQNGIEIASQTVAGGDTSTLTAAAAANEPVYILSTDGGLNVYGIILTSGTATENPTPTPSDETCVKIAASYNEDGVLAGITVTEAPVSEATAAVREGNVLTTYWDSLDSMKPVTGQSTPDEPDKTQTPDEPVKGVIPEKTAAVGNGIWLSADDLAQAEYKETVEINGFYIGADDSADDAGKSTGSVTVDSAGSNGATVNGTKYYNRIKTGGKGDPETGVRCFYFTVDSDCTIVMDATSSSGSAARDVVVLHGDAAEHITVNEKAGYTVTGIKAGETVIIYSTEGGLNVYGISLTPESGGTVTELWTASEADAGIVAGTELLPGLTTLFDNTSTNKGYITGTDNGSIGGGVVTGTALKYEAYANGRLSVSVQKLDSDKTLYVIAEGGKADETATAAVAGVDGSAATIEASVEAGTTYYIWIAGSRGRFMAAAFTAE